MKISFVVVQTTNVKKKRKFVYPVHYFHAVSIFHSCKKKRFLSKRVSLYLPL